MLKPRKSFKKELKRQMKYAIAAAVGFLIAFAWRDAVYATVHGVLAKFEETTKFITSEISTASVITVIGVLIIILSSRLLREKR